MFSEAMSSISSRWRPSSRLMTSATSGSVSVSGAVNRLAASAWARDGSVMDVTLLLGDLHTPEVAGAIAHPPWSAKLCAPPSTGCPHLAVGPLFFLGQCAYNTAPPRGP